MLKSPDILRTQKLVDIDSGLRPTTASFQLQERPIKISTNSPAKFKILVRVVDSWIDSEHSVGGDVGPYTVLSYPGVYKVAHDSSAGLLVLLHELEPFATTIPNSLLKRTTLLKSGTDTVSDSLRVGRLPVSLLTNSTTDVSLEMKVGNQWLSTGQVFGGATPRLDINTQGTYRVVDVVQPNGHIVATEIQAKNQTKTSPDKTTPTGNTTNFGDITQLESNIAFNPN